MGDGEPAATDSRIFKSKYKKLGVIGKGSFGEAVLVRSREDSCRYVVKAIETNGMSTKELNDVRNEIGIMATVNHPNIVRYHEHFQDGTFIFIAMEYADGGDLSKRIKERRKENPTDFFDHKLVMEWFMQIAMAVQYLHSKHILHRDLKSANVFLTSRNVVKLGDFGISTVLRNTVACAKTVCGTPYYFSPEICQGRPYNNKSDIWSLGILLYEMLCLQRPFNAKSLKELLGKILACQYEPLSKNIPQDIRAMCTMLLHPTPAKRPSIVGIFETAYVKGSLRAYAMELSVAVRRDPHFGKPSLPVARPAGGALAGHEAPTPPTKAPSVSDPRADMMQLRKLKGQDVRAMLQENTAQLQAEVDAQKSKAKASGPVGGDGGRLEEDVEYDDEQTTFDQQLAVSEYVSGLVQGGVTGGDGEFGAPNAAIETNQVSLGNGQVAAITDVRALLENAFGAKLLNRALEYVNNVSDAPADDIQYQLHSILGVSFSHYSNAVTRLAMWESTQKT